MNRPRSSQKRYRLFVEDYRHSRLDDDAPPKDAPKEKVKKLPPKRRQYLREYLHWLKPHGVAVGIVFVLALANAGMSMVEPLFMRHIIDRVLLNNQLDTPSRISRLNVIGAAFLALVIVSNLMNALREYRQKMLNTRVMLSLRRSLFDRLLK